MSCLPDLPEFESRIWLNKNSFVSILRRVSTASVSRHFEQASHARAIQGDLGIAYIANFANKLGGLDRMEALNDIEKPSLLDDAGIQKRKQ